MFYTSTVAVCIMAVFTVFTPGVCYHQKQPFMQIRIIINHFNTPTVVYHGYLTLY